jgi:hypothetical protein
MKLQTVTDLYHCSKSQYDVEKHPYCKWEQTPCFQGYTAYEHTAFDAMATGASKISVNETTYL